MIEYPEVGHGDMKPASQEELEKDAHGYTHPNLHRRTDIQQPDPESSEVAPRDYQIGIYNDLHSIRMTNIHTHDEESTTCEIP